MCRRSSLRDALSWMESLSPTLAMRLDVLDAQAVKLACELRAAGDMAQSRRVDAGETVRGRRADVDDVVGAARVSARLTELSRELDMLRRRIADADDTIYPALVAAIDRLAGDVDASRSQMDRVTESAPPRSHVRAKTIHDLDGLAKRHTKP